MDNCKITRLVLGPVMTNCYIIKDLVSGQTVVIDPADQADRILKAVKDMDGTLSMILLTHGHFDHICAASELKEQTGAKLYAGAAEKELLADPCMNLSDDYGMFLSLGADLWLKDGDIVGTDHLKFRVYETPGHTEGGVCYYLESEGLLFSGDTLFDHSVGRTDFPTGSMSTLIRSICGKLYVLPEETVVLPGHGEFTRIGTEMQENPFTAGGFAR